MEVSAMRFVSHLNSHRIICSYRFPLTLQVRHLSSRITPVNNCRLVPLGQRRFSRLPERLTPCSSFVRWNSSSSSSSGVQNDGVSFITSLNFIGLWVTLKAISVLRQFGLGQTGQLYASSYKLTAVTILFPVLLGVQTLQTQDTLDLRHF